jgi:hypothetical protein
VGALAPQLPAGTRPKFVVKRARSLANAYPRRGNAARISSAAVRFRCSHSPLPSWCVRSPVPTWIKTTERSIPLVRGIGGRSLPAVCLARDGKTCGHIEPPRHVEGAPRSPQPEGAKPLPCSIIRACGAPPRHFFAIISGLATVNGLGFFDFWHGQRGVAPNAIELHPVLGFHVASCKEAKVRKLRKVLALAPFGSDQREFPAR